MRRFTDEVAAAPGIYHSDCKCKTEIRIRKGEQFPACPACHRSVAWHFTRSAFADPPWTPDSAHHEQA